MQAWIAWTSLLFPVLAIGCENNQRRHCQEQIAQLVSLRAEALENAFGDLSIAMPAQLSIKFLKMSDAENSMLAGGVGYDPENHVLMFSRAAAGAKTPNPIRVAAYYWPFYQKELFRREFPIVEAVDNALWGAFLQEAARRRGLTWPHPDCKSVDPSKRLPCEMLMTAIAHNVKLSGSLIFNENRLDRIWPENLQAFHKRTWRHDDPEYLEVRRYGGILLIRPLIGEFGVPRVLAYIAQTPFLIEANNLHTSALRYQDLARNALRIGSQDQRAHVAEDRSGVSIQPPLFN